LQDLPGLNVAPIGAFEEGGAQPDESGIVMPPMDIVLWQPVLKKLNSKGEGGMDGKIARARLDEIAAGQRGRVRAKELKNVGTWRILEAKCGKGPRILWYEDTAKRKINVCAICHHDAVSRKLSWIVATLNESARVAAAQGTPESAAEEEEQSTSSILLDADTRTPIKVFAMKRRDASAGSAAPIPAFPIW